MRSGAVLLKTRGARADCSDPAKKKKLVMQEGLKERGRKGRRSLRRSALRGTEELLIIQEKRTRGECKSHQDEYKIHPG